MAGAERKASVELRPSFIQEPDRDQAVDESSDVDGDFADRQKMLSQRRRAAKDSPEARLKKALPCVKKFVPNIRPLTIADLESCIALENAAFPHPEHRASAEKFAYRLTVCPELSLGVFLTINPEQAQHLGLETLALARPVETGRADGAVSVLLAHAVATRCRGDVVADADMGVPQGWRDRQARGVKSKAVLIKREEQMELEEGRGKKEKGKELEQEEEEEEEEEEKEEDLGHYETGSTIGLHSLAVLPRLQRCGIGQLIVKAYLDQMKGCGMVPRVALICQDHLVSYYERSGFTHVGESKTQFGGGGWHDMVYDLPISKMPA